MGTDNRWSNIDRERSKDSENKPVPRPLCPQQISNESGPGSNPFVPSDRQANIACALKINFLVHSTHCYYTTKSIQLILYMAKTKLSRLVGGFSLRRPRFRHTPVDGRFVLDCAALGQTFVQILQLSVTLNQCSIITHLSQMTNNISIWQRTFKNNVYEHNRCCFGITQKMNTLRGEKMWSMKVKPGCMNDTQRTSKDKEIQLHKTLTSIFVWLWLRNLLRRATLLTCGRFKSRPEHRAYKGCNLVFLSR